MSFWRTFGFHTISAIDTILDKESFTLEELLDEDEIIQETKSQNKKLLEYLTQPEPLSRLFEYLRKEPEEGAEGTRKAKYSYVACEILSSEVWCIAEAVYNNEVYVDQVYSFLDHEMSPVLVGHNAKVAASLMQRKIPETLEYLKKKDKIVDKFVQHLRNPAVMELLLKVVSSEETPEGQGSGVLQWLAEQNLIPALVGLFEPTLDEELHENAAQALVEIINFSARPDNGQGVAGSPLLVQLESEEILKQMFAHILSEQKSNSSLQYGLTVLIELLRKNTNTSGHHFVPADLPPLFKVLLENLEKFTSLIDISKDPRVIPTTFGELSPPFGFHRLKVIEFFVALIRANQKAIDEALVKSNLLSICLDLFFTYQWNNFLHSLIEQMMLTIFEGENEDLKISLFSTCKLAEKIAIAARENDEESDKPKGVRRGYMGHLTNISIATQSLADKNPAIKQLLEEDTQWTEYTKGSLQETMQLQAKQLGGHRPLFADGLEEEEDLEMDEKNNTDLVNVFTQYLVQQGYVNEFADFNHEQAYDEDGEIVFEDQQYDGNYNIDEAQYDHGHYDSDDDSDESDEYEDDEEDYDGKAIPEDGEPGQEYKQIAGDDQEQGHDQDHDQDQDQDHEQDHGHEQEHVDADAQPQHSDAAPTQDVNNEQKPVAEEAAVPADG